VNGFARALFAGRINLRFGIRSCILLASVTRYDNGDPRVSSMPRTRVLLADEHVVVAQGLETLLKQSFELVGIVHDGRALVDAAEKLRPDVIVTDISMALLNGLDAIRQIRARRPDTKVIVLTMHQETQLAADAFRAGASGYLLKVSPGEELITAIGQVALGRGDT
jgi:DNA-binding NarL/FixJ family response regulator